MSDIRLKFVKLPFPLFAPHDWDPPYFSLTSWWDLSPNSSIDSQVSDWSQVKRAFIKTEKGYAQKKEKSKIIQEQSAETKKFLK